jgi:hypothetical protein
MTNEQPVDLAAINADDALLDALGAGRPVPADDPLAGMLQAWRADLDDDQPTLVIPPARPAVAAPKPRSLRWLTAVAAAVLVVLAGLSIAVNRAGPSSPLWPLTQVMYPEQADTRAAQHAVDQARAAFDAGHYDEARRRLDEATTLVAKVKDDGARTRLQDAIAQLRAALAAKSHPEGPSAPPPSAAATTPAAGASAGAPATDAPGPSPAPTPEAGATTSAPGSDGGRPNLPLPSLPLPLPSLPALPLPSLLPSLPQLPPILPPAAN